MTKTVDEEIWDDCPDADHAVWWLVMDLCPRDFERAVRLGKVAFLAKFLGLPTRMLVKRARAFKEMMIKEGRLDPAWCDDGRIH